MPYIQTFWAPSSSAADPAFHHTMDDIVQCRMLPNTILQGRFGEVVTNLYAQLGGPCPFHRRKGKGKKIAECCLQSYRKHLALQKKEPFALVVNPMELDEAFWSHRECIFVNGSQPHLNAESIMWINYTIKTNATYIMDISNCMLLKFILDASPYFHNVGETDWFFGGQLHLAAAGQGISTFGRIELVPDKGKLKFATASQGHLKTLSSVLKSVVADNRIKILGAELAIFPVSGKKPHSSLVNELQTILVEGLDHIQTSDMPITIDTVSKTLKACAYCGLKDEQKLVRCPCMAAWYCGISHQKKFLYSQERMFCSQKVDWERRGVYKKCEL
jgi:hypothetical protein